MITKDELFKTGDKERIWKTYCSFLDLSLTDFMELQEQLLMDHIELGYNSPLAKKFMSKKPKDVSEFRELVPLTTYDDYAVYLGRKNEDVLAVKPYCWVHTSGRRVGGTSAGAINATLLALGFTNAEQKDVLWNLDFKNFMDDTWGVVRDIQRLIDKYGWYKGDFFHEWISGHIKKKLGDPNATFQNLKEAKKPDLYVYGTNLSTHFGEVFSIEHTPTMRIADAVRILCLSHSSLQLFEMRETMFTSTAESFSTTLSNYSTVKNTSILRTS
jgi:Patatin-like phospholipase/GH3 auxin-responsive promoter